MDYMSSRLTYRFDDVDGYVQAVMAPALTTQAFSARSRPSAAQLGRLTAARETSQMNVRTTELAAEAPNTSKTQYVVVTGSAKTTYVGGGGTSPVAWTLRLVETPGGPWRVDGVLSSE